MSRVKINFRHPVTEQIQRARNLALNIDGNPNFPTPNPTVDEVNNAADNTELAYEESLAGDRNKKAVLRLRRKQLAFLISLLAAYVQNTSEGDEEKILSSGFEVVAPTTPLGPLPAPTGAKVLLPLNMAELTIIWKPVRGAGAYVVQICDDPLDFSKFEVIMASTRAQATVKNLQSGKKYWFRITAIGAAGFSPFCEPVAGRTKME